MEQTFLHGTIRERLQDLMKSRKVSQAELAARIDCSESMLSRFLSGKTDKLGNESVIRIARGFNISTDFLLGETDVPDCVTYDVSELGLSVQAARNLYTQKVNPKVVNALLENPAFAETTELIYGFLNDEFTKGIPHTTLRARSCAKGMPSPLDSPATKPSGFFGFFPTKNIGARPMCSEIFLHNLLWRKENMKSVRAMALPLCLPHGRIKKKRAL